MNSFFATGYFIFREVEKALLDRFKHIAVVGVEFDCDVFGIVAYFGGGD